MEATARYARRHNVTKIVVGRAQGGWARVPWLDRLLTPGRLWHGRGFAEQLARACPDIDILRVAAPAHAPAPPAGREPPSPARAAPRRWPGYGWALAYCALATGVSQAAFPLLHQTNIVMFYLLAVVGVALRHGRGPAALASVVSVPLFDYFFVQPISSFAVSDVQYVLTFAVLLGVGLLIGQLTAGLRVQAETSVKREADARALYEFARELSSALQSEQIVQAAETFLKAAFDADSALYILGLDDRLRLAASCGMAPEPALAQWVQDHGQPAGAGTRTLANSPLLYLPLAAPMRVRGVLVLRTARPVAASPAAWRQAQAYATLIAIAVERLHYVEVAQQALLNVESEKLRNSLLAAVSHDLRTPLTGLIGMTETLARGSPDAATQEQALAIRDQARRMHLMVVNLLDMARLQSHGAPLKREWQSIEELVGAALATMRETLRAHRLRVLRCRICPWSNATASLSSAYCAICSKMPPSTARPAAPSRWKAKCGAKSCKSASPTRARASRLAARNLFSRSSRAANASRRCPGSAWACRYAAPSSRRTTAASGWNPRRAARARALPSNCRWASRPPSRPRPRDAMFDYQPTVLIVEDDPHIRRFVRQALESEGCAVFETETVQRGLIEAGTRQPDAIVLDLGLPDEDGMALLRELRGWTEVPVLVLSARAEESDKIAALDAGADDYLTKPFGVGELLARLRVLLRRHARGGAGQAAEARFGDVHVDLARRLVTRAGQPVHLTPMEYRLLAALLSRRGKVVTHRELLREVWGPSHVESNHYLRIYMGHLRQKLEADPAQPAYLLTEVGVGYRYAG